MAVRREKYGNANMVNRSAKLLLLRVIGAVGANRQDLQTFIGFGLCRHMLHSIRRALSTAQKPFVTWRRRTSMMWTRPVPNSYGRYNTVDGDPLPYICVPTEVITMSRYNHIADVLANSDEPGLCPVRTQAGHRGRHG